MPKKPVTKAKPAVLIELDKQRHILLDLNAMVAFEEETGKNLFDSKVTKAFTKSFSPKDLRALLWASLLHEDENLTLKQVGSWIHTSNMEEIADKLVAAWVAAVPEGGKDKPTPLAQKSHVG